MQQNHTLYKYIYCENVLAVSERETDREVARETEIVAATAHPSTGSHIPSFN